MGDREEAAGRGLKMSIGGGGLSFRGQEIKKTESGGTERETTIDAGTEVRQRISETQKKRPIESETEKEEWNRDSNPGGRKRGATGTERDRQRQETQRSRAADTQRDRLK